MVELQVKTERYGDELLWLKRSRIHSSFHSFIEQRV